MGDDGETPANSSGENSQPTANQDELILAQQRQIEQEVKSGTLKESLFYFY